MNALTAVKPTPAPVAQQYPGFSFTPSAQSPRLLELTFSAETTTQFLQQVAQWPVQALEYKSFLRFQVGKILDDLCGNQLQPLLIKTLLDRAEGALLINGEGIDHVSQAEEMVKLATAVAHLIGRSNFDAMSGQYYARFVVKNVDNSDSYLRQPHRVMELHNDGTYVEEQTDYVLMMKIDEQNMQGGNSLLLHLDDWEHLDEFFRDPLARRPMRWAAPPSKNVSKDVFHPVFDVDSLGRPVMRYIDQFVQPKDFEEGTWLSRLSDALETSKNILSIPVPVGKFLLINNLFWLHGLDADRLFGLDGRSAGKNARRRPRVYHLSVPRRVFPAGTAAQPDRQPFDLSDPRSGDAVPRRPPDPHDRRQRHRRPQRRAGSEARRLPQARYLAGRYPGDPHLARHPPGTAKQPALRTGRNEEFAVQKRLSAAGAKILPEPDAERFTPVAGRRAGAGRVAAGQADRRFSLRYHRAFDTYLQCAIASGHLRYPDRRAYRQQGAEPAGQPEQSRTHAACGT